MVVILVNLTVDSGCCVLVAGLGYGLVLNGWVDSLQEIIRIFLGCKSKGKHSYLMNCGVMFSIFGEESTDSCLGLIHFDLMWCV